MAKRTKKQSPSDLTMEMARDLAIGDADSYAEGLAVDLGAFEDNDGELRALRVRYPRQHWREISRRALVLEKRAAR
jgi:hypothetical protein